MSLIIHGSAADTSRLVGYLVSYTELCRQSRAGEDIAAEHTDHTHGSTVSLTLSTKYYTVSLALSVAHLGEGVHPSSPSSPEGYILVPSVDQHDLAHATYDMCRSPSTQSADLKLLVLFKNAHDAYESRQSEYIQWALDHGFEFIEVDTATLMDGHDERDKDGLPRVMEALEANMWPGMIRRPASTSTSTSTSTFISSFIGTSSTSERTPAPVPAPPLESPAISGATDTLPRPPEAGNTTASTSGATSIAACTKEDHSVATRPNSSEEGGDDAPFVDDFEQLLTQARAARESAAGGTLSDEQRRQQAARIVLQMARFMEHLDDDDDDDDDDNDEDNDNDNDNGSAAAKEERKESPLKEAAEPTTR